MLISHKHKFITIDIPKTGTRSLRETLSSLNVLDIVGKPEDKVFYHHGNALKCKKGLESIGLNFSDYFSFCVVRNPWERYLSFFKYYKEKGEEYLRTTDYSKWAKPRILQGKFASNLFANKDEQKILQTIIHTYTNQTKYYTNENQEIIVSHIARFENLQKEFNYFCKTIGLDQIKLLHSNKSVTQISCSDIYNQELIDLVAEKEQCVIKLKNYQYIR
jgi:hypothetical protein